jgi:O-antigen ligase
MIKEKPFVGWGVGGEASLLGTYPHNIFLELCLNFGLILGGVLCIILVVSILATFFASDGVNKDIFLIYLCTGFVPLLISATYLTTQDFFSLVFIMVDILKRRTAKGPMKKKITIKKESLSRPSYG